jgi:hypothetical protein
MSLLGSLKAAKETRLLGGQRQPRIEVYSAGVNFPWRTEIFNIILVTLAAKQPRVILTSSFFLGALYLAGFAWRPTVKNHYLGGKPIFLGGFQPPRQFAILVLSARWTRLTQVTKWSSS